MQKKVLTEQALYYGDVAMPKDWDIDRDKLSGDILQSQIQNKQFPFSRTWDMLNTYMRDHIGLEYGINLINKETWGNIYKPAETTIPLLNIDPVDLRNSPDFTLLYGVKVKDCMVRIHYLKIIDVKGDLGIYRTRQIINLLCFHQQICIT